MPEHRKFSRVSFISKSALVLNARRFPTQVLDISLKGALVLRPEDWSEADGTQGSLELHLEGSDITINMACEMAHIGENRIGLRCVSIDVDSMVHLRRLLELNLGDPTLIGRELVALE